MVKPSTLFYYPKLKTLKGVIVFTLKIDTNVTEVEGDFAVVINFLNSEGCCLAGCVHVIKDSKVEVN